MVGCVLGGSGIKAASDVEALVNTSTEIWLVCIAEAGKLLTLVCRQCSLLGKLTISYRLVHNIEDREEKNSDGLALDTDNGAEI